MRRAGAVAVVDGTDGMSGTNRTHGTNRTYGRAASARRERPHPSQFMRPIHDRPRPTAGREWDEWDDWDE